MARVVEAVHRSVETGDWQEVSVGPAGTAWRFGLALALSTPGARVVLDGDKRLRQRPIAPLLDALKSLGATWEGDVPPHRCTGRRLRGGPCTLDASASSQHLSALLLVAPWMEHPLDLHLTAPLVSAPYAEMTAALLRKAGVSVASDAHRWKVGLFLDEPLAPADPSLWNFDPDWSAAAVHVAAVAVTGRPVVLNGLRLDSLQGDKALLRFLPDLGVQAAEVPGGICFFRDAAAEVEATELLAWDFSDVPDTAQVLLTAAMATGRSGTATGLHTLSKKEIDRTQGLDALAQCLNVKTRWEGGTLAFQSTLGNAFGATNQSGERTPFSRVVSAEGDHRQAFSWALVQQAYPMVLEDPECVSKSYPGFWENFHVQVGA
jgi:3-phosphoshikimate 1-carboxyvinyltransferase